MSVDNTCVQSRLKPLLRFAAYVGAALAATLATEALAEQTLPLGQATIQGEVRLPGAYDLQPQERLSQLLQRAGGLTDDAYPYGAKLLRQSAKQAERELNQRATRGLEQLAAQVAARNSSPAATAALNDLIQRLRNTPPVGRVPVEADPTVLAAKQELDILLQPGDVLYVPKRPVHVEVQGEVRVPGSLPFRPNTPAESYIRQASGTTKHADKIRTFAVLPNQSIKTLKLSSWNYERSEIPPGSIIFVPRKVDALTKVDKEQLHEACVILAKMLH